VQKIIDALLSGEQSPQENGEDLAEVESLKQRVRELEGFVREIEEQERSLGEKIAGVQALQKQED